MLTGIAVEYVNGKIIYYNGKYIFTELGLRCILMVNLCKLWLITIPVKLIVLIWKSTPK